MQMNIETRARYEWIALRCQAGEPEAFEDLIAVMERPLLYYAASLTGNPDSALDVLQEVWIKVVRGIGKLKDPGSLRSWLYTITHGIAVDRIRRNALRERAEEVELEGFQEAEEPSFTGEDAAAIHQALSQIGLLHQSLELAGKQIRSFGVPLVQFDRGKVNGRLGQADQNGLRSGKRGRPELFKGGFGGFCPGQG